MPGPVFVHAWWRAATTWFWSKLREQPGLRCYYEPLHERLASASAEELRRERPNPEGLRSFGHPELARSYFAEYIDLTEAGRLRFDPALSYERYLLHAGEPDGALQAHLGALIDHAQRANERPVLCFVRSALRAGWIRQRFPGLHIAQLRNPRDQWCSFRRGSADGRSYFTGGMLLIARCVRARAPRAFSHLAGLGPPLREFPEVSMGRKGVRWSGTPLNAPREYGLFMLLWLASALHSLSAADLVLDCDRLTEDTAARARASESLAAQGLAVDFADAGVRRYASLPVGEPVAEEIEALALRQFAGPARALVCVDRKRVEAGLEALAPLSRSLLERALAALD